MKLQAKFTLYFVVLVAITVLLSFFLISRNLQAHFNRFILEKRLEDILKNQRRFAQPLDLQIILETPEQRFTRTLGNSLWGVALIVMVIAVVMAYFLSNVLLKRIHRLQGAMQQYAKDGKSRAVIHEKKDEIDDLATIYNVLIEKIEKEKKIRQDFFVDMSHELRTPLTSIKGYLEGLIDEVFDREKEKDIHEKTLTETDRMIHLVKEMTTLAKLETEKINLAREAVDLRKLSEEVWEMFRLEAEKRNIALNLEGELTVNVDPFKFKQVIINLLDNAIHYGLEASPVTIEMGTSGNHNFWRIKNKTALVREEELQNFFERFYRADKSRSYDAKKPHLGIGLNIVKKIVEQHGYRIEGRLEKDWIIFEISIPV